MKYLLTLFALTVFILYGCGEDTTTNNNNGNGNDDNQDNEPKADKIMICHKTGSTKNPYVQISVSENAIKDGHGHGKHQGDIIPAPEAGCPDTWIVTDIPAQGNGNDDQDANGNKITICHKTGSAKNPYVQITVSENAIKDGHGHGKHDGDIIPAPEGGCPDVWIATDVPAN